MLSNSIPQDDKLAHYRGLTGGSFAIAFERDTRIRGQWVNDTYYLSLVDFAGVWGEPKVTARRNRTYTPNEIWKNERKRLLKRKPELEENFFRLKLVAEDGKLRETEVCDVETAIRILFYMDTPASDEFKDLVSKLLDHLGKPEWPYRKHFASFDKGDTTEQISQFMLDMGLKGE